MSKWIRNYKLTIRRDGQEPVVISHPSTLQFTISRADLSAAGTATFQIYNIDQSSRGKIHKNVTAIDVFISIKLEAGYGNKMSTVFDGNVMYCRSFRAEGGVDVITEMKAYDYAFVMVNSKSSFTVEGQEASQDAYVRRLCKDLKYPVDGVDTPIPIGAIGALDTAPQTKRTADGPTWDLLKQETGNGCFIDNGKVFCMGPNEAVPGANVTVINSGSGLLGTPRVDDVHLIAEMIFEPGLKIGQVVRLESESIPDYNGTYKVVGLDHYGIISGAVSGKCKTKVVMMVGSAGQDEPYQILAEGQ